MKEALIVYYSQTGNTEKVMKAIKQGLEEGGIAVTAKKADDASKFDYFDFDLICVGSPSIQWHPAKPIDDFLKGKLASYRKLGKILPCSPKAAGKNALIFITYSGPHTGIDEALPAGKYIAQFFEHIGFRVLDDWYILSEFHGNIENSTIGKMGDIRGKPTDEDLLLIKENARALASKI